MLVGAVLNRDRVPAGAGAAGASTARNAQSRPCYNCRRRRLRCDRSLPSCHKCWAAGERCLGYGTVLRWANAPAVRGKLAPQLPAVKRRPRAEPAAACPDEASFFIRPSLLDPLLNRLNSKARHYLHHFATAVCRDLVSVDQHDRNPYRVAIPLAAEFDFLEAVIIATGAMHLAALHGGQAQPGRREFIDALVVKDRAIKLLRSAVDSVTPANLAMVLATTVFFINLDLIDSGKGGWQAHIDAASTLMSTLHGPAHTLHHSLVPLIDAITADFLTYVALGSAISGVAPTSWAERDLTGMFAVLRRAEPHTYHCCPPEVLRIVLSGARLCNDDDASGSKVERALALLHEARSLDVVRLVHSIRGLSAEDDLDARISLASAHRATACLYILLAVPEADSEPRSLDRLAQEVLGHLAAVSIDNVHLKGTVWPTFMAGAQTDDPLQRAWCVERMQAVWAKNPWVCPWGYIRTAIQMLHDLWEVKDRCQSAVRKTNWLQVLKGMRDKCLIV